MIRQPKSSPPQRKIRASAPSTESTLTIPAWLRVTLHDTQSPENQEIEDLALAAGAALSVLDTIVRRHDRWAGAWRQRLALSAAAATAKQAGRVEDETALRDAIHLTRPGDDVGPAGRMLVAWQALASRPPEELLTPASIVAVLDQLGLVRDDEVAADLAGELQQLVATNGTVGPLTGAFRTAESRAFPHTLGCWFADVMLARKLGWTNVVPLLGSEAARSNGAGRLRRKTTVITPKAAQADSDHVKSLLAAQGRAALRAIDLSAELGRRAERLVAAAPKLRARGADMVVERLLTTDSITASEMIAGMSDRGLRRLFDRLILLGVVRELSGRPTFRIYGI